MRVLALDYGSARCGCALSDPTGHDRHADRRCRAARQPPRACGADTARAGARGGARCRRTAAVLARGRHAPDKRDARLRRDACQSPGRGRPGRALRRALHHPHRRTRRAAQHQRGLARRGRAAGGLARAPYRSDPSRVTHLARDRGSNGARERTEQERERAREERERRRLARAGASAPPLPPPLVDPRHARQSSRASRSQMPAHSRSSLSLSSPRTHSP